MWDPEFAIDFVRVCFPRILDSHYKVDITGTSLLGATLSDVTFIFCTLTGILKKKIANTDIFFSLAQKIVLGHSEIQIKTRTKNDN